MNILIISTNAIGDTFLSLSAIKPLTIFFSNGVSFTFVISSDAKFLFEFHPEIELIKITRGRLFFPNVLKVFLKKYDFVISFFPGRLNGLFVAMSSSDCKYSFASLKKKYPWHNKALPLFVHKLFHFKQTGEYWQPEQNYLELIEIILKKIVTHPFELSKLYLTNHENESEIVVLHFLSKYKDRSLNPEFIKKMVDYLLEKNQKLVVIADRTTDKLLTSIGYGSDEKITYLAYPKLSELVKVIGTSKLFIGCDSFPIHIADALNKKILGIFGPTHPKSVLVNHEYSVKLPTENLYDHGDFHSIKKKMHELITNDCY